MSDNPPLVLVVDDSPTQTQFISLLLKGEGYTWITAEHGQAALEAMRQQRPDVVVTDLKMPVMDGLELVEASVREFPEVPVILTTAQGSEEIAAKALKAGAASYVPKRCLAADLACTLKKIMAMIRADEVSQQLAERLTSQETQFSLGNDDSLVPELISFLHDHMRRMKLGDENFMVQVGTALDEALMNAIFHGNLEVSSKLREVDGGRAFAQQANERKVMAPYQDRDVFVSAKTTPAEAVFVIRDQGPGFDPSTIPDPRDPENLEKVSGRGLLLINYFMDEVSHNSSGNEITMVKRKACA